MKEPNNLRNRYRRYVAAMRAYGWSTCAIEEFKRGYTPNAYSAEPHHANYSVPLIRHPDVCRWRVSARRRNERG